MPDKPRRSADELGADLRRLAETSREDRDRFELLQEVQIYQEELTVQNEELTRAQLALEDARDRFIELYDFAPNGYLTLDAHGLILQLNLTAAALIGKSRQAIEGMPLLGFVSTAHRTQLLDYMRRCRQQADGASTIAELALDTTDGPREVQLFCRARRLGDGRREYLTTIFDLTERKELEAQRDKIERERAALAGRLISAQEDERQRFARDLHDNVGQQMTALRLKLAALAGRAPTELAIDTADLQAHLEELDRQLDFLATELRPAVLDAGIVTALREFVREWSDTCGIAAGFQALNMDGERLEPDVETHLYRVAQEALHNVYKHARAGHVSVLLERRQREIVLLIEDDGRGFDSSRRGRGFGLVGMRERASIVRGDFELESVHGKGTTVYLRVPVEGGPPVETGRRGHRPEPAPGNAPEKRRRH